MLLLGSFSKKQSPPDPPEALPFTVTIRDYESSLRRREEELREELSQSSLAVAQAETFTAELEETKIKLKNLQTAYDEQQVQLETAKSPPSLELHVLGLIQQVEEARSRQEKLERQFRWQGGALNFTQYIVGAVLATAFIQEQLSSSTVGFLGVLVLISSLISQRLQPEILQRGARYRVSRLSSLMRDARNDLAFYKAGVSGVPTIDELARTLSEGLKDVDRLELEDQDLTFLKRKSA